jgi:hypothetical protein
MSSRKAGRKRDDESPPRKHPNFHSVPKDGKITVTALFDGIYQAIAGGEGKRVAPAELQELRKHLDESLELLEAISKKKRSSQR